MGGERWDATAWRRVLALSMDMFEGETPPVGVFREITTKVAPVSTHRTRPRKQKHSKIGEVYTHLHSAPLRNETRVCPTFRSAIGAEVSLSANSTHETNRDHYVCVYASYHIEDRVEKDQNKKQRRLSVPVYRLPASGVYIYLLHEQDKRDAYARRTQVQQVRVISQLNLVLKQYPHVGTPTFSLYIDHFLICEHPNRYMHVARAEDDNSIASV